MRTKGKNKKKVLESILKPLKVRLDRRTVITVKSMKVFEMWKEKYPEAQIMPL